MPLVPGQRYLIEQPLLKRSQDDLKRAEQETISTVCDFGPSAELIRVVWHEMATGPVALEYRSEIFATASGLRASDSRTFHSKPVICAEWVRFDDPIYAVE